MFSTGDHVVYHGVSQLGSEWLATVQDDMFNGTYLIKFRDSTMKLVSEHDIEPWDGPEYEGEAWDSTLPLD